MPHSLVPSAKRWYQNGWPYLSTEPSVRVVAFTLVSALQSVKWLVRTGERDVRFRCSDLMSEYSLFVGPNEAVRPNHPLTLVTFVPGG